jgi:hypothetical protein
VDHKTLPVVAEGIALCLRQLGVYIGGGQQKKFEWRLGYDICAVNTTSRLSFSPVCQQKRATYKHQYDEYAVPEK